MASNRTVSPPEVEVVVAEVVLVESQPHPLVVLVVVAVLVTPGTKKAASPLVRPPVTAISARAVVEIAKLPAKRPKQTTYRVD